MEHVTSAQEEVPHSRLSSRMAAILAFTLVAIGGTSAPLHGQGCVSARHLPSPIPLDFASLVSIEAVSREPEPDLEDGLFDEGSSREDGARIELPRAADDVTFLDRGDIELTLSLRAMKAEDVFVGTQQINAAKAADVNPIGEFRTLDMNFTYGLSRRWSLSLNLPLVSNDGNFRLSDGKRHALGTGIELGDLRVTASRWLFDPGTLRSGNVVLGFGLKAPTGNDGVTDQFFTADGESIRPLDGALQPGDGGWGLTLQAQGFQMLANRTYYYGDAFYLINPRETSGVVTPASGAQSLSLSVPDQYQARTGLGYLAAPRKGISLSLGVRLDGIPRHDLVGGAGGFRRPGYNFAVEPAAHFNLGPHLVSVYLPLAIKRSRQQSMPEAELGIHPGGSMADEQLIVSYSRRYSR